MLAAVENEEAAVVAMTDESAVIEMLQVEGDEGYEGVQVADGTDEQKTGESLEEDLEGTPEERMPLKPAITLTDITSKSKSPSTGKSYEIGLGDTSFSQIHNHVSLAWADIHWSVSLDRKTGERKQILKGINGHVKPGEVLAIIGPSGCGKTSLLHILSGLRPASSGEIHYNGRLKKHTSIWESDVMGYHGNAAYVQQTDNLMGALSVRQTLEIATRLKVKDPKVDVNERVEEMLVLLGLKSAADAPIGNVFLPGISGGQKRRVSIGVEIMNQPAIIFLDEPTSGLDSNSAYQIIQVTHELAKLGHTVLMTIHQPSSKVFEMMCQWQFSLLILESGRMVFQGKVEDSTQFFADAGFPVPAMRNPFDHYLDVINSQFNQSTENADRAVAVFEDKHLDALRKAGIASRTEASSLPVSKLQNASWWKQVWILAYRNLLNNVKDPAVFGVRLVMYSMLCLCIGSLYWNMSSKQSSVVDRVSILFFVAAFLTFMAISGMPAFVEEKHVFIRERVNNHYSAGAYVLANTVASAPFIAVIAAVSTLLVYFMVQSRTGAYHFGIYLANLFTALMVAESMMLAISAIAPVFMIGLAAGAGMLGLFMCVCGFFLIPENIPKGWLWVHYGVSFHTYSFSNFMLNEFRGFEGDGWKGRDVLEQYSMEDASLAFNFGILIVMFAAYRLLFFLFLRFFNRGTKVPLLQVLGLKKP